MIILADNQFLSTNLDTSDGHLATIKGGNLSIGDTFIFDGSDFEFIGTYTNNAQTAVQLYSQLQHICPLTPLFEGWTSWKEESNRNINEGYLYGHGTSNGGNYDYFVVLPSTIKQNLSDGSTSILAPTYGNVNQQYGYSNAVPCGLGNDYGFPNYPNQNINQLYAFSAFNHPYNSPWFTDSYGTEYFNNLGSGTVVDLAGGFGNTSNPWGDGNYAVGVNWSNNNFPLTDQAN